MIKEYLIWNWALLLVLAAFGISLMETVFLDKTTIRRMYVLIVAVFLLSIVVFAEFYMADLGQYADIRVVLMAIRYSATPFIIAQVIYTFTKKLSWFIFVPAIILALMDALSIFNGLVFSISADNIFHRGPLGTLPFIMVGMYGVFLIYMMIKQSNKQKLEIIPIAFLGFAVLSGVILPFVYGSDYSHIFCTTIAIGLYVYYVFSILQLTKKDSLTGLLNRQTYYADIENDPESITAMILIDMNDLKTINDSNGHTAGDEALKTLALCILSVLRRRQLCYRIGGDEFVVVCRKTSQKEMLQIVEDIKKHVADTRYSCSVGYSHITDGAESTDALLQKSDKMMYAEKANYYKNSGRDRRQR